MSSRKCPVKHTCPDIDNAISKLDTIISMCSDIIYEAKGTTDELEYIRSQNSSLRDWGEELSNEISDLESQIEELQDKLNNI